MYCECVVNRPRLGCKFCTIRFVSLLRAVLFFFSFLFGLLLSRFLLFLFAEMNFTTVPEFFLSVYIENVCVCDWSVDYENSDRKMKWIRCK